MYQRRLGSKVSRNSFRILKIMFSGFEVSRNQVFEVSRLEGIEALKVFEVSRFRVSKFRFLKVKVLWFRGFQELRFQCFDV
jgi:hypothetical protein